MPAGDRVASVRMSQCKYNVVFYRIVCVTLLATAFTFTVILTDVFIDIDGLLSNKNKLTSKPSEIESTDEYRVTTEPENQAYNDDKSYDNDVDPMYRTRRSIEAENAQIHIKDLGLKKILTSRLESLLKELDDEGATINENKLEVTTAVAVTEAVNKISTRFKVKGVRNEELLHLAMHNILLQGMIGHMDLNDVYKKVHKLVNNFSNGLDESEGQNPKIINEIVNSKEDNEENKKNNEEHKLLEEIIHCKKLEKQIEKKLQTDLNNTKENDDGKDKKLYIKTIIEINENEDGYHKMNFTNSPKSVEGLISLIYNGKSVKINQIKDIPPNIEKKKNIHNYLESTTVVNDNKSAKNIESIGLDKENHNQKHKQNPLLNKFIEEYLKSRSSNYEYLDSSGEIKSFKTKRLKRQIKIRYFDNKVVNKTKTIDENTKDNDDIYIEIETHIDGKGIKAERKKKLIKTLIEKIQKALVSDIHEINTDVENFKLIKRIQNPIIGRKQVILNKMTPPDERVEKRSLDPIDKTLKTHENIVKTAKDTWKKIEGPKFLSVSKTVNSAEMSELNINYDSVLKNGIPKRLQKPIYTDIDDEKQNTTDLYDKNDLGNVTLYLKDIDGSGFSIGINQYVGEPPDKDSINMFNGLENLIHEYHRTYDRYISNETDNDETSNFINKNLEITKINNNKDHKIVRRSIAGIGTDNNNQKVIIPFEEYLTEVKRRYHTVLLNRLNEYTESFSKNKILKSRNQKKNVKSSENMKLAEFIHRKKRSLSVKRISNVNSKMKLSKYINTNAMAKKKIFLKNKRNKRQVNKIRIATKEPQVSPKSDEDLFLMSREYAYADKATAIKQLQTQDRIIDTKDQDHYDEIYPIGDVYRIHHHNTRPTYSDFYDTKSSSNRLMSKYPHIFINDDYESKEDLTYSNTYDNETPYRIQPQSNNNILRQETMTSLSPETGIPKVEEIVNAILPSASKANYKLTVKISPKNLSNISTGFKEVHTSVNKSFDENGLHYFSLLNVSQISKIEKLNQTTDPVKTEKRNTIHVIPLDNQLKEQQMQIKTLLELHKKRVDQQLDNLYKESQHLEKMIKSNKKNNINKTIHILHDDMIIPKVDNDDKINKILASIKTLEETYKGNIKKENVVVTEIPATTYKPKVDSIQSNERINNEILKKIDTNTNILKAFLLRLSNNLNPGKKDIPKVLTTEKLPELRADPARDWINYQRNTFYAPGENKNATVPFIYAYHQKTPQATMVYGGHIHTNALQNDKGKEQRRAYPDFLRNDNIMPKFNQSKFFIDEFENDFKIPNKPRPSTDLKINATTI